MRLNFDFEVIVALAMEYTKNYVEKLDPQPQLLVEWGLMKLKAWRISVSS
jgi:hypothetical protein